MNSKIPVQHTPLVDFWHFDAGYWFQHLNSAAVGLSQQAAIGILLKSGKRSIAVSGFRKDFLLLLSQFKSPLTLLLIGAVILSAFLRDTPDAVIILFIVLSATLLSFIQERNAGKVVEKLQSMISLKSTVLRDGKPEEIPSADIVPGDVILLKAGDMVPQTA